MGQRARVSQCMIVKNEEKNIRRALSWGKGTFYEQIVVDTGSTDQTVEIAEEMGAKVYHLEWIGDFSAAKNYAIEQAKGNWIAFLDADEYFAEEDVKKLYKLLENLERKPEVRRQCVIRSALLELDDDGKVFSTTVQNRVFSNTPYIRYINKIHEKLKYSGSGQLVCVDATKTLSVYHTGYSASAYRETDKLRRNISLLEKTVEERPENYEAWVYLGESLYAVKRYEEAERAFEEALSHVDQLSEERRMTAYFGMMRAVSLQKREDVEERLLNLRRQAIQDGAQYPDLDFWIGKWMYLHHKKEETVRHLEAALQELEAYHGIAGLAMTGELEGVYGMLAHCSLELGDKPSAVRYGVLVLRMNRYVNAALETILVLLRDEPGQDMNPEATLRFLEKLYDFTQIRDRLYVMKAAKKMGFHSLYDLLYEGMTNEEKAWMNTGDQSAYRLKQDQIREQYPEIPCENEADTGFITLIEEVKRETGETLLENLKETLRDLRKKQPGNYEAFSSFFSRYPFWGTFEPEVKEYGVLESRVHSLKDHVEDFVWLYGRLTDRRSRRTLLAVMDNWLHLNLEGMARTRENGTAYFDTDLIPSGRGEVFVDAGAYIGDSAIDYIKTYGEEYQRVYCYEITPESVKNLKRNTRYYRDIEIRGKAVGDKKGSCCIEENEDQTANRGVVQDRVSSEGHILVEMVTLDEDIEEAVDFIKLDVDGMEEKALRGCEGHIRREHPKLAVSVYYGYEDIWKLPRIIDGMSPDYHFYLRNYGGNLIPTKIILYAV